MDEPRSVRIQTWRIAAFLLVEPDRGNYICTDENTGLYLGVATAKDLGACIPW